MVLVVSINFFSQARGVDVIGFGQEEEWGKIGRGECQLFKLDSPRVSPEAGER
jgi:hypothetical protein